MQPDPERRRALRHARKRDKLGPNPRCAECETDEIEMLESHGDQILCQECRRRMEGKRTVDGHHLAGEKNDPSTVPIGANDHAVLSDLQYDWPKGVLDGDQSDPLKTAMGFVFGTADIFLLIDRRLRKFGYVMYALWNYLNTRHPGWPEDFEEWRESDDKEG